MTPANRKTRSDVKPTDTHRSRQLNLQAKHDYGDRDDHLDGQAVPFSFFLFPLYVALLGKRGERLVNPPVTAEGKLPHESRPVRNCGLFSVHRTA